MVIETREKMKNEVSDNREGMRNEIMKISDKSNCVDASIIKVVGKCEIEKKLAIISERQFPLLKREGTRRVMQKNYKVN